MPRKEADMLYSKEILSLVGITLQQIQEGAKSKRKKIAIDIFKNKIAKIKAEIEDFREHLKNQQSILQNYSRICKTGTALQIEVMIEGILSKIKILVEEKILYSDALDYLQKGE